MFEGIFKMFLEVSWRSEGFRGPQKDSLGLREPYGHFMTVSRVLEEFKGIAGFQERFS